MNLDVLDVTAMIPPAWPLRVLSTFVTRSLRRTLHARCEGQIVKAISAGQNLAVADHTWAVVREQGAVVEEPASDDEGGGADGDGDGDEKKLGLELGERVEGQPASFNEKFGLHHVHFAADAQRDSDGETVEIDVAPGGGEAGARTHPPDGEPYNVGL